MTTESFGTFESSRGILMLSFHCQKGSEDLFYFL